MQLLYVRSKNHDRKKANDDLLTVAMKCLVM